MGEVIPGVCTPVFVYILLSFSGLFLVLINGANKDAGMMGFLIFMVIGLFTTMMSIVCNMGFTYVSWMICMGALGVTGFLIDNKFIGKVDLVEGAGLAVRMVVGSIIDIYNLIKSVSN
jgi:hypothetical protein